MMFRIFCSLLKVNKNSQTRVNIGILLVT